MSDTDATTITALMRELEKVDLATWKEIRYLLEAFRLDPLDIILEPLAAADLIQGCIQRAIAAKGWEYQIAYQPHVGPDDMHGHAYIWHQYDVTKCYESEEDTPPAAILAAYVQAKRASR